jgi:UDP-3-O-[3-hydroxymyristoyl] glucosamine N-acyltransferase
MSLTLREIAALTGGELVGDGSLLIEGLAKIEDAGAGQLTFVANPKYQKHLRETRATAVIVPLDVVPPGNKPVIRVEDPYFAFLLAVRAFFPEKPFIEEGVHPTAVIGREVKLGEKMRIGAHVVIGDRCQIGSGTTLMPGVVLGNDVTVGIVCVIHANVSLREGVILGDRIIIHDGTVIGSDGFGFAFKDGKYHKIPQVGTVVIEDDVEIGANVAVDRASMGETRIKKGAKLDNLIQIAHNCTVGENTAIAAQTGLSGSTRIGKGVRVGGQAGFAGHLEVGDFAAIVAQSGVDKNVHQGDIVSGSPARPHREAMRMEAAARHLPELLKQIRTIREKIETIERKLKKEC